MSDSVSVGWLTEWNPIAPKSRLKSPFADRVIMLRGARIVHSTSIHRYLSARYRMLDSSSSLAAVVAPGRRVRRCSL